MKETLKRKIHKAPKRTYKWLRKNLFRTPLDSLLTILFCYLLYKGLPPILDWVLFKANFKGDGPEFCGAEDAGACWVFIKVRFNQFMYGFYPRDEQWRINLSYVLATITLAWLILPKIPYKKYVAFFAVFIFPIICYVLYVGDMFGLTHVRTALWGGLHLTLVIAVTGIVCSLPIGVVLALGRRSDMPTVRGFCTGFIELWRGVPLISVLFMASVMFPLFVPEELQLDKLLRALIGVTLFSSAYMAEVVRGGLQAIPKGQYEAAKSLGLSYWQMMIFIVLPQALKLVIPGIVNTFIGLFKDTTLVLIIGLFDLLGMVQAANTDPKWLKYNIEGYVFAGFGFWIFCFLMSRYSIYLEKKLHTGR